MYIGTTGYPKTVSGIHRGLHNRAKGAGYIGARGGGLEPPSADSKSAMLPVTPSPMERLQHCTAKAPRVEHTFGSCVPVAPRGVTNCSRLEGRLLVDDDARIDWTVSPT